MKGKYYNKLMEQIETVDETERYIIVSKRIDEIIQKDSNPKQTLEALICMFEGKRNNTVSYSILSILYAVVLASISIMPDELFKTIFSIILAVAGIIIGGIVFIFNKKENREGYVLSALRLRYESEYTGKEVTKSQRNKEYIVKVEKL